jgi:hypothetical protein
VYSACVVYRTWYWLCIPEDLKICIGSVCISLACTGPGKAWVYVHIPDTVK